MAFKLALYSRRKKIKIATKSKFIFYFLLIRQLQGNIIIPAKISFFSHLSESPIRRKKELLIYSRDAHTISRNFRSPVCAKNTKKNIFRIATADSEEARSEHRMKFNVNEIFKRIFACIRGRRSRRAMPYTFRRIVNSSRTHHQSQTIFNAMWIDQFGGFPLHLVISVSFQLGKNFSGNFRWKENFHVVWHENENESGFVNWRWMTRYEDKLEKENKSKRRVSVKKVEIGETLKYWFI